MRVTVQGDSMTPARARIAALALAIAGAACSSDPGAQGTICADDRVPCGQRCLDVSADPLNCGGCGIPCAAGQSCGGGVCQCPSGMPDVAWCESAITEISH